MSATTDAPAPPHTNDTSGQSPPERLADLVAKATAEYTVKHYSEAAEFYSQATELQAEINGEMALENADLLYSYGKCLFFLAQQTSSVLGGTAASAQLSTNKEKKAPKKRKTNGAESGEASAGMATIPEDAMPTVGDVVPEEDVKPQERSSGKAFFQITGDDENWDGSDNDEEDQDGEAEDAEDEEDDFATAYELLDLARILYLKKLDQTQESALEDSDKGKYVASIDLTPEVRNLKTRVADIYDLQAEVSLEGEKYSTAVTDLKACLALKEELEPPESSILAECHYKLSLALEFSAQTQQRDADGNPFGELQVDWDIRNEAVSQQEKAIDSCKLRVSKETAALDKMEAGPQKDKAMAQIEDVQDMISEMEVRLKELREPPVSVKAETDSQMMKDQISGILGSIMGSSATAEERKEKLAQVSETATDLTGLVKRKKPKSAQVNGGGESGIGSAASTPAPLPVVAEGSGSGMAKSNDKRKVESMDDLEEVESRKKAKVEDTEDSGR
ncbi:uncharacterized protein Z518_07458 [Rhinocladiella mackenziei CBS 650.93]|uniref:Tetratricopeptide SHNi-TPR domain-containing protein n=1 Tax=Rhinocladiella mackenziei CBS 650.93 TaxID=1442369 RepID=A0A0D2J4G8_9EURO|nr:uncharacterized protein Z518_07458 [Rhinocladiella mackenziei CBS 650.93]KIX03905.1 hypothetical protein Z518_07458 [Rhinocladiella mackenziei CBS 650.93]